MPLKRKELTPEQKRIRGKRMLALLLKQEAKKNGEPDPFPRKNKSNNK